MIRKGWSWTALVAGLIGMAAALVATVMHYNILNKGFDGPSFCAISAQFDCDTVMASSYSSIFGIPVAGLALIYYLIVVLYIGFALWLEGGGLARLAFSVILSIPALIITAVMAYLSIQVLETICLVCAIFCWSRNNNAFSTCSNMCLCFCKVGKEAGRFDHHINL